MSFGAILFLAVGLAMDATAVAAVKGMSAPVISLRNILLVAVLFGGFQGLMPMLGWLIGRSVGPQVQAWDHWIIFAVLTAIGVKMLWEARSVGAPQAGHGSGESESVASEPNVFGFATLVLLAVATSIDAFAVGITLPMLNAPLITSWVTIAVTTALLSAVGLLLGRRFGAMLGRYFDLSGGLALIALGVKVLVEHLSAA